MSRDRSQTRSRSTSRRGSSYDEAPRISSQGALRPPASEARTPTAILTAFALAFLFVVLRLAWLQLVDGPRLAESALNRRTYVATVNAKRGTIYDRNGNVLAMSVDCSTIYCNPQEITDAPTTASVIASVLGGQGSDWLGQLTTDSTFVYLRRQADKADADHLKEKLAEQELPGIYYLPDTKRTYPYGAVAGQILGFVGIDGEGLSGLELYYDEILSGTNGELRMEVGRDGTPIAGGISELIAPDDGADIIISIDIDIQRMAEEKIVEGIKAYEAETGSVMVVNPANGEILAACSTPFLDLTRPEQITPEAMNLKLVSSSFEPGSIFKVLTMSVGLESGQLQRYSTWTVPPEVQVGDDMVSDDDKRDWTMDMDIEEVLRRSSNAGTVMAARTIGADVFAEGVDAFGIGHTTGIDYPGEVEGLVATRDEYQATTLPSMAFGQELAIPMVQMVRAVGTIANDGVPVTPHFLVTARGEDVEWEAQPRVISAQTADTITAFMRTVVNEGTAQGAAVEGYDIAAKTGTGQQTKEGQAGYVEGYNMSSLIGFCPADDPTILVYVGLNGTPYRSSESTAMVFSAIMGEALMDMGVAPTVLEQ